MRLPIKRNPITAVTINIFFGFKPAFWWTSINRYHGFSRVCPEQTLSPFLEHSEEQVVFAILCYRIWHRFISRLRGVLNLLNVCRRKLRLSTYLQTVIYNYISFLNARSQLGSSQVSGRGGKLWLWKEMGCECNRRTPPPLPSCLRVCFSIT